MKSPRQRKLGRRPSARLELCKPSLTEWFEMTGEPTLELDSSPRQPPLPLAAPRGLEGLAERWQGGRPAQHLQQQALAPSSLRQVLGLSSAHPPGIARSPMVCGMRASDVRDTWASPPCCRSHGPAVPPGWPDSISPVVLALCGLGPVGQKGSCMHAGSRTGSEMTIWPSIFRCANTPSPLSQYVSLRWES